MFSEELIIYGIVMLLSMVIFILYLRKIQLRSKITGEKINQAKAEGLHEPVSLHPVINPDNCIQSGACIKACPEHDIIGIQKGIATIINASSCIGHGACFHACPVQAISLVIGTEKRGVELPHVDQSFETNIPGLFIAGELGGMGLIKNCVEQGKQAMENILKYVSSIAGLADYEVIIVGAGPAGISASLTAKKNEVSFLTLEQDTLGGTVFSFPRSKIVMTSPMELPLFGKIKLFETSKTELLRIWKDVLNKNNIQILENCKVESIQKVQDTFHVHTATGNKFTAKAVLVAIGRRGTPRKLNIKGEEIEKVAYRLLEPENIKGKNIVVVGGGDSAIESALLLADQNKVILTYRGDSFSRLKIKNREKIEKAGQSGLIDVRMNTNLICIEEDKIELQDVLTTKIEYVPNDLVYIFAGGELPTQFLEKAGIQITKRFGHTLLSHK